MQLLFSIKNQTLYFRSRSIVVADSQGYLTAKFTFSDDWVDVDKYAQFKRGDLYYDIKLDENDECVVPWELLTEEGVFNVNVLGLNKEGNPNKVITVNSVDIIVEASGITKDMDATNPTEGVFGESVRIALRAIDDSKDDALQEIADGTVQALSSTGIWESGEQVKVGDVRYMHGRDYAGYVLECVQAGTTGASQPIVSTEDIDNTTDLEYMSGTLPIAHGGTGATTAEGARSNLGLTYATQSEAEAGTDNTKVMTPKGVDYRLNKNRRLQTYLALSDLNYTVDMTEQQMAENMPSGAELLFAYNKGTFKNFTTPFYNGILRIRKEQSADWSIMCYKRLDTPAVAIMVKQGNGVTANWKKIATNGALSMPSLNNKVSIDCQPNSSSNYTAPCDGWLLAYGTANTTSGNISLVPAGSASLGAIVKASYDGEGIRNFVPLAKGAEYVISSQNLRSLVCQFYYAQSEV